MNTLQEAMLHFRRRHNNIKFLVFSDDPDWCTQQSLFEADDVLIMGRDMENKKSVKGNDLYNKWQVSVCVPIRADISTPVAYLGVRL